MSPSTTLSKVGIHMPSFAEVWAEATKANEALLRAKVGALGHLLDLPESQG